MSLTSSEVFGTFQVKSFACETTPFLSWVNVQSLISPKSRLTVRPASATSSTFVTCRVPRSRRYETVCPSDFTPTSVAALMAVLALGSPVAAIVSSGASAVLLSSVSVSGENATFCVLPASGRPRPSISMSKLFTSNQLPTG